VRITGVRTILHEYEVRRSIGDVQLPDGARRIAELAVFLTTDEGVTGVALGAAAARPIVHTLAEQLVGKDPQQVRGLYELMLRLTFKAGTDGVIGKAIAALDTALWDIRAKHAGVPLWRELGGSSDRAAAYASGLDMPLSDAALRTYYREMAQRYGITAGKLKVGRDPDRDLERLAIMRDAIIEGSGTTRPSLMVDANEFWTPKQAIRRISEIERQFDLVWAEEPVRRDDHRGLSRVSHGIRAAVATGENLTSVGEFMPLLLDEAADVVQVSVQATGVTNALRIAEMSDALGLPVALVNCPGRYAAHIAAVLPNHLMMEVIDAGRDVAFRSDHRLEGGWIVLGDAPGLGITFDEERLAELAVDQPSSETLGSVYHRAIDSGISEPGIPVAHDAAGEDGSAETAFEPGTLPRSRSDEPVPARSGQVPT
jgi:L-alanine-DL-glutamate epimerase-like enolase superfamily enzyme